MRFLLQDRAIKALRPGSSHPRYHIGPRAIVHVSGWRVSQMCLLTHPPHAPSWHLDFAELALAQACWLDTTSTVQCSPLPLHAVPSHYCLAGPFPTFGHMAPQLGLNADPTFTYTRAERRLSEPEHHGWCRGHHSPVTSWDCPKGPLDLHKQCAVTDRNGTPSTAIPCKSSSGGVD